MSTIDERKSKAFKRTQQRIAELEQALAEKERRETTFTNFLQRYIDYWQHKTGGHADTRGQTGKFIYEQWCELDAIDSIEVPASPLQWLNELRMLLETIRNLHPDIEDWPEWIAACESGAMDREYYPPVSQRP